MKITDDLSEKSVLSELAQRFRQYRISCSMTRDKLADKSMVSVGTIARFENGNDIGFMNIIKLLKAVELEGNLDVLIPDPTDRPSYHIDGNMPKKRARKHKDSGSGWKWGDEE